MVPDGKSSTGKQVPHKGLCRSSCKDPLHPPPPVNQQPGRADRSLRFGPEKAGKV